MARLTKQQEKLHSDAEALLSLSRGLKDHEVWFVLENWREDARHLNLSAGAFFTPLSLAYQVSQMATGSTGKHFVDLGAGIGMLTWMQKMTDRYNDSRFTAIEYEPDYVEVGKRLMPDVEWICDDVLCGDLWLDRRYDCAISNPPYGQVTAKGDHKWVGWKGPAHFLFAWIAVTYCECGGVFVFPQADLPWMDSRYPNVIGRMDRMNGGACTWHVSLPEGAWSKHLRSFMQAFPHVAFESTSIDTYVTLEDEGEKWRGASPNVEICSVYGGDGLYSF